MREKLKKMIAELRSEEKNLRDAIVEGETKEERMSAQEALDKVLEKIADINAILAELDEPAEPTGAPGVEGEGEGEGARSKKFSVLGTMTQRTAQPAENREDVYSSIEYAVI